MKTDSRQVYMLNFVGIALIICGFIVPSLSGAPASYLLFLPGFLILLRPANPFLRKCAWRKWAQMGVLLYTFGLIVAFVLAEREYFRLLNKWSIIINPIRGLINFLFPVKVPVEKIIFGSFRSTVSIFLNILIYICSGIIIGKLIQGRRTH